MRKIILFRNQMGAQRMPVWSAAVKNGADECEIGGQGAVCAPQEVYAEQFGEGASEIEPVGFERWTHFVGMAAGEAAGTCACCGGTVQAFPHECEGEGSGLLFPAKQFGLNPLPDGTHDGGGFRQRQPRPIGIDPGGDYLGGVVCGKFLGGIVVEWGATPPLAVVAALAA